MPKNIYLCDKCLYGGSFFPSSSVPTETVESSQSYYNALLNGRNSYPPRERTLLSKIGDEIIKGITIGRTELISALKIAGEYITGEKIPYDKFYHLFLIMNLANGQLLRVEKNHQITLEIVSSFPNAELLTVNYSKSNLTVDEMLNNTKLYMGGKFFLYQAFGNNCQDFVISVFNGNHINLNQQEIDFIKQDVKGSFNNNKLIRKISNTATDLARVSDVALNGAGVKKKHIKSRDILYSA